MGVLLLLLLLLLLIMIWMHGDFVFVIHVHDVAKGISRHPARALSDG